MAKASTVARCRMAYQAFQDVNGFPPDAKELAKLAGFTLQTIRTVWEEVIAPDEMAIQEKANSRRASRKCLGCGSMFDSISIGNRLCGNCKGRDYWDGHL